MKKRAFIFIISLALAALFVSVNVRNASSLVAGGLHDLSINGDSAFSYTTQQVCIFCHTPHHAATTTSGASSYLWNRALPYRTYTPYLSSTLNAYTQASWQGPGTLSLLCLSCHDGVGSMNVLLNFGSGLNPVGSYAQSRFGDFALTDPNIGPLNIGGAQCAGASCSGGGDLQDDHPIGFSYDAAQAADSGLKVFASIPPAIQTRLNLTGVSHNVECPTCHDPHITNTRVIRNNFLIMNNSDSSLCLGCHIK